MNYTEFMNLADKPTALTSSEREGYPLWFGKPEELLEEIDEFSVIDDYLGDQSMESMSDDFASKFPDYVPLAICDSEVASEINPGFHFDSYSEFFFVVDRSQAKHPVLCWSGETEFEACCASFEEFHATLAPYEGGLDA